MMFRYLLIALLVHMALGFMPSLPSNRFRASLLAMKLGTLLTLFSKLHLLTYLSILVGVDEKVVVIGVAADSGCGKSTFMRRLTKVFGGKNVGPLGTTSLHYSHTLLLTLSLIRRRIWCTRWMGNQHISI